MGVRHFKKGVISVKRKYSVIVIGAGSVGMAAGYNLGKRGVDTLLIDAHNPPHQKGSHHGKTRLIRHASGEGAKYVPLILRAQELWRQLEGTMDKKLFYPTGTLIVGEEQAPFIKDTVSVARQCSLPLEKLTVNEMKLRWPAFSLPNYFTGYFEPTSGALLSQEIIRSYKQLSVKHNVEFQANTTVSSIHLFANGAVVNAGDQTYYADKIVISAGAWTKKILNELDLPLQVVRKTFGWFETKKIDFQSPNSPCFYFSYENQKYYGFPDIDGRGIKVGRNDSEVEMDPDAMEQDFGKYKGDEGDLKCFINRFIPGATFKEGKVCMITKTPDKHFIIDTHPDFDHVFIAGGFSGHGFKYSSVIGEILSQLVVDGSTPHDISFFSMKRSFWNER